MGWLSNFGANGCRNAMRASYKKAVAGAPRSSSPKEAHVVGLWGAYGSRLATRGVEPTTARVTAELVPFLMLPDRDEALDALAEYAVYEEAGMNVANWELLSRQINRGVMTITPNDHMAAVALTAAQSSMPPAWTIFLDKTSREHVQRIIESVRK